MYRTRRYGAAVRAGQFSDPRGTYRLGAV